MMAFVQGIISNSFELLKYNVCLHSAAGMGETGRLPCQQGTVK